MESALRAKLMATAAISQLVATRIDWGIRAQGATLPAIVLHRIIALPQMNLDGASGWSRDLVQLDVWGRTFKAAQDIADLIGGKPGTPGLLSGLRDTVAGVRLRVFVSGRRDDSDSDAVGPLFRSSIDLLVWHSA